MAIFQAYGDLNLGDLNDNNEIILYSNVHGTNNVLLSVLRAFLASGIETIILTRSSNTIISYTVTEGGVGATASDGDNFRFASEEEYLAANVSVNSQFPTEVSLIAGGVTYTANVYKVQSTTTYLLNVVNITPAWNTENNLGTATLNVSQLALTTITGELDLTDTIVQGLLKIQEQPTTTTNIVIESNNFVRATLSSINNRIYHNRSGKRIIINNTTDFNDDNWEEILTASSNNFVDTETDQSIGGNKTFSNDVTLSSVVTATPALENRVLARDSTNRIIETDIQSSSNVNNTFRDIILNTLESVGAIETNTLTRKNTSDIASLSQHDYYLLNNGTVYTGTSFTGFDQIAIYEGEVEEVVYLIDSLTENDNFLYYIDSNRYGLYNVVSYEKNANIHLLTISPLAIISSGLLNAEDTSIADFYISSTNLNVTSFNNNIFGIDISEFGRLALENIWLENQSFQKNISVDGDLSVGATSGSTTVDIIATSGPLININAGSSTAGNTNFSPALITQIGPNNLNDSNDNGLYFNTYETGSGASNGLFQLRAENIYSSTPIRIGADTAANEFDDYEEGMWTPIFSNANYTTSNPSGRYVKIGRKVTLWGYISIGGFAGTLNTFLDGTPFAASADYDDYTIVGTMNFFSNNTSPTPINIGIISGGFFRVRLAITTASLTWSMLVEYETDA